MAVWHVSIHPRPFGMRNDIQYLVGKYHASCLIANHCKNSLQDHFGMLLGEIFLSFVPVYRLWEPFNHLILYFFLYFDFVLNIPWWQNVNQECCNVYECLNEVLLSWNAVRVVKKMLTLQADLSFKRISS